MHSTVAFHLTLLKVDNVFVGGRQRYGFIRAGCRAAASLWFPICIHFLTKKKVLGPSLPPIDYAIVSHKSSNSSPSVDFEIIFKDRDFLLAENSNNRVLPKTS